MDPMRPHFVEYEGGPGERQIAVKTFNEGSVVFLEAGTTVEIEVPFGKFIRVNGIKI
jgi:hypothetical protein